MIIVEYAGFKYEIWHEGTHSSCSALPGQHLAAYKTKHLRAALEQYPEDRRVATDLANKSKGGIHEMTIVGYAGFKYEIWEDDNHVCKAIPVEGQHPAAGKGKHRRAALSMYLEQKAEIDKRNDDYHKSLKTRHKNTRRPT